MRLLTTTVHRWAAPRLVSLILSFASSCATDRFKGLEPIHWAALSGDVQVLTQMLAEGEALDHVPDHHNIDHNLAPAFHHVPANNHTLYSQSLPDHEVHHVHIAPHLQVDHAHDQHHDVT